MPTTTVVRIFSSQAVPITQSLFFLQRQATQLPSSMPDIVWRAGLDLNPIDVSDPAQADWLEALVWPEQTDRLTNLRAAIKIATTIKPLIARGDLRHDLVSLVWRLQRTPRS